MEKIKMTTPLVEMDGDEMTRILWQQIKDELEAKNITMSQFFEMAAKEHFDKEKGGKTMANGRTLAFTVSEELFQRVKEYLAWYERTYHRRLTQKEFVISLIEQALEEGEEEFEAARAAAHESQQEQAESSPEAAEVAPDDTSVGAVPVATLL